jgi:hypothetical protein
VDFIFFKKKERNTSHVCLGSLEMMYPKLAGDTQKGKRKRLKKENKKKKRVTQFHIKFILDLCFVQKMASLQPKKINQTLHCIRLQILFINWCPIIQSIYNFLIPQSCIIKIISKFKQIKSAFLFYFSDFLSQ